LNDQSVTVKSSREYGIKTSRSEYSLKCAENREDYRYRDAHVINMTLAQLYEENDIMPHIKNVVQYSFVHKKEIPSVHVGYFLYQNRKTKQSFGFHTTGKRTPLDIPIHLRVRENFKWNSYCEERDLSTEMLFAIL